MVLHICLFIIYLSSLKQDFFDEPFCFVWMLAEVSTKADLRNQMLERGSHIVTE